MSDTSESATPEPSKRAERKIFSDAGLAIANNARGLDELLPDSHRFVYVLRAASVDHKNSRPKHHASPAQHDAFAMLGVNMPAILHQIACNQQRSAAGVGVCLEIENKYREDIKKLERAIQREIEQRETMMQEISTLNDGATVAPKPEPEG